jgi:hypothetical protein
MPADGMHTRISRLHHDGVRSSQKTMTYSYSLSALQRESVENNDVERRSKVDPTVVLRPNHVLLRQCYLRFGYSDPSSPGSHATLDG